MIAAVLVLSALAANPHDPFEDLARCDVVWTSPSSDAAGSMPIGNGSLGANAWVEPDGDLVLLVSHTDAWSETSRLLKLGRVRIVCDPPLHVDRFEQRLRLERGAIEIRSGERDQVEVFVDAGQAAIRVAGAFAAPRAVRAELEVWRTEPKVLRGQELDSSWAMRGAPDSVEVRESADRILDDVDGMVAVLHRNDTSIVPFTLRHQGLEELVGKVHDPLLHRELRLWAAGDGFVRDSRVVLTRAASSTFDLVVGGECVQRVDASLASGEIRSAASAASRLDDARARTAAWWRSLWSRSYVFVEGAAALPVPSNAHPLRIGADSDGANVLRGAIARASIFDRALGPDAIEALALGRQREGLSKREGLLASWPFSGTKGGWPPDTAGAGIDLSQQGHVPIDREVGAHLGQGYFQGNVEPRLALPSGFTLEAWIRLDADAPAGRIFDKLTAGRDDGWLFDTHPGRALRLIVGSATLAAPDVLVAGEWTHVAATCDAKRGELRLYRNGELVASSGDAVATQRITQSHALQRYVTACASRGASPIKFNGSIFSVEPRFTNGAGFDADWRKWGGDFWWQNTRLPYQGMLARGESELMQPLFDFYARNLPLCVQRAKLYHGVEGAYFPETMTSFGSYSNGDYGWDRANLDRNVVQCPWWQWAWNQGLELVALALDRYEWTRDAAWAKANLLELQRPVLRWFDTRFERDERGVLVISPTQALETYWDGVVGDLPTVAGLRAVTTRLLEHAIALDAGELDIALWRRLQQACPPIPKRTVDEVVLFDAAQKHDGKRSNVENPELYSIHPFGLHGVGRAELEIARASYLARVDRSHVGWTQDGIVAARVGLASEAAADLVARSRNSHPSFRFPAMWGPNFDWLPDQCHGSNLTSVLQEMLMQCHGDAIELLPAWPKEWSARFKLHAPRNTLVEGRVRDGQIEDLVVTPSTRRADVRIHAAQ